MGDFGILYSELLDECLENDPAFKKLVTDRIKENLLDAVKKLDVKKLLQSEVEGLISYLINEDSEMQDAIRDTISEIVCDKIEVNFKK